MNQETGLSANGDGKSLESYRAQITAWRAAGESFSVIAKKLGVSWTGGREACRRWMVVKPAPAGYCVRCEIMLDAAPAGVGRLCGWCVEETRKGKA